MIIVSRTNATQSNTTAADKNWLNKVSNNSRQFAHQSSQCLHGELVPCTQAQSLFHSIGVLFRPDGAWHIWISHTFTPRLHLSNWASIKMTIYTRLADNSLLWRLEWANLWSFWEDRLSLTIMQQIERRRLSCGVANRIIGTRVEQPIDDVEQ